MAVYNIYAGLGGGSGEDNYLGTFEFRTAEEAKSYAYEQAVEKYQNYEGSQGILSWDECRLCLQDSYPEYEIDDEWVDDYYLEEIDSQIDYWVEEVK